MNFKTLLIGLAAIAMTACSDDEPEVPQTPPEQKPQPVEPVEVTISIDNPTYNIYVGEMYNIPVTVSPENTVLTWTSSDRKVALVDRNGQVMGLTTGTATITATHGEVSASCIVTVSEKAQAGDFYYSDGTWSSALDPDKTPIGIVFWAGDPTADDAALRRDHPNCTNGLVISAVNECVPSAWQARHEDYNRPTGPWIEQNAPQYESPVSVWMQDTRRNKICGYNNTKALEAFNAAAENSGWPVTAVESVAAYRSANPAPESSSDWYLPSVKELTLLINSDFDGEVFYFNNTNKDLCLKNKAFINMRLSMIDNAEPIGRDNWAYDLWSSTDWDNISAYQISTIDGSIMGSKKDYNQNQIVRCILAF